MKMNKEQWY